MPTSPPAPANGITKRYRLRSKSDIPFLGLFKERQEGAGHTFGNTAVREYINMTDEPIFYIPQQQAKQVSDTAYLDFGYEKRSPKQIDAFGITPAYRSFTRNLSQERANRPAALRDVMDFPVDIGNADRLSRF